MITYSNTKPWITVHFNLYKLNRCTPAAEHTNYHFSSKQTSQKMHTRDIFSILYSFIISQFSTARPEQSPPGLIPLLRLPLKHPSFTCILLHLAASSNFSAWLRLRQNKLCFPSSDIMILLQLCCENCLFTEQMQEELFVILWLLQHNHGSSIRHW